MISDTNLTLISFRDFGFEFVSASNLDYSQDGSFVVCGTREKDIPNTIKEPNQAYLLKNNIDSINIFWTNINSINGQEKFFRIYPNPNDGHFKIEYSLKDNIMYFEILDITGNLLDNVFISDKSNSINIDKSKLSAGIYFIRARLSQGLIITERMVISR